jgi:hypothetical protein
MYHCFRMQCGTIIVFEGYLSSNEYTDGTGMTHWLVGYKLTI